MTLTRILAGFTTAAATLLPAQGPPVATLQARARAVVLDVVVTDGHGHAVRGLKSTDFQVLEDGAAQPIKSFEEIKSPDAAELAKQLPPKLPPNTFSNAYKPASNGASTVLLIDVLDSNLQSQAYVRDQVLKYLDTAQPTGPIAIFALTTKLHIIQGFTGDQAQLHQAMKDRDKIMDTVIPRAPGYVYQKFRSDILSVGMTQLGAYLAQFPGRKNLVWFTGSIPFGDGDSVRIGSAIHDPELFELDQSRATEQLSLGHVSVYPIDAEGLRADPNFSAARRGVPRLSAANSFATGQGLKHIDLARVADATGGKAFYNTNGIKQALAEVVDTGANYYTISYTPSNDKWDGSYRKLKVNVSLDGLQLEYRHGYYALNQTRTPPPLPPGPPDPLETAADGRVQLTHHEGPDPFAPFMQLGAIDPGTIVFETQVTAGAAVDKRNKGDKPPNGDFMAPAYVGKPFREYTVNYTVAGKQLQMVRASDGRLKGRVEFVVVVTDDQGALVNSAQNVVEMNVLPETYQYMADHGAQIPVKIDVPAKGTFFLRAGVHDFLSGKGGALEVATGGIELAP